MIAIAPSDALLDAVDAEVRRIIEGCYEEAKQPYGPAMG